MLESFCPGPPKTWTWNLAPMIKVIFLGSSCKGGKTCNGMACDATLRFPYMALAVKVECPRSAPLTIKVSFLLACLSIRATSLLAAVTSMSK